MIDCRRLGLLTIRNLYADFASFGTNYRPSCNLTKV
jgi:hypothetical protein